MKSAPLSSRLNLLGGVVVLWAGCAVSAWAQTYVLGSPDQSINSDSWALNASSNYMLSFRTAITNPANFGPSGTVTKSISVVDLTSPTPANLSGLNGLMVPWWSNTQSAPYTTDILAAFHSGMDLWLLEDDSLHNGIGTALGIVSSAADGSVSNGNAPFFSGPFGSATNTATYGNFDQFDPVTIAALGGTVAGTNASGQVTVVYWAKGTFGAGTGALVLFSDVDMISNANGVDPFSPLNANGILGLNTMAWLANGAAIPEPGTYALMGLGGLLLIAFRRRRR